MKIIVTGGYGFIGSSFVNYCSQQGHDVFVIDKMTYAANPNNVTERHSSIHPDGSLRMDICDVTADDLGDFDYLVNFAAESHVDNSIEDGSPFVKSNIEGVFNLLEISRKNKNLKKFVQISTDEVYGDITDPYYESKERDALRPSSYYSATKASADMLVHSVGHTFGMPYLITRTCNNFGRHQHKEKFLPVVEDCFRNDNPIPLYGDGQQMREWIWVEDNVRAIYNMMVGVSKGIHHIGSYSERYTNYQVLQMFSKHFGKPIMIDPVSDRLGHDRRYALETPVGNVNITKTLEDYIGEL
jgi:dTDP-glucose 4,6-dehydratase